MIDKDEAFVSVLQTMYYSWMSASHVRIQGTVSQG